MSDPDLLQLFVQFGLAGLIGFLLGLEREMSTKKPSHIGIRDFVFFALLGATSAFIAGQYANPWIIIAVFGGVTVLLITQYWASHEEDIGITTEMAAILTFILGVLLIKEATELAIALAILASGILFQKEMIQSLRERIKTFELQAVLKFLIITFIILPVLPRQTLDTYLSITVGRISAYDTESSQVEIAIDPEKRLKEGNEVRLYIHGWEPLGAVIITDVIRGKAYGNYTGNYIDSVGEGTVVRMPFGTEVINTALSALKPYKLWLIVVLVSFISFVGYVLIKLIGESGARALSKVMALLLAAIAVMMIRKGIYHILAPGVH